VSESPPDQAPVELRIAAHGAALGIVWARGASSLIAAAELREACRCASCAASGAAGKPVTGEDGIAIATVEPIGGHAVNIGFSDGHARGIYPWRFLRELAGVTPGRGTC